MKLLSKLLMTNGFFARTIGVVGYIGGHSLIDKATADQEERAKQVHIKREEQKSKVGNPVVVEHDDTPDLGYVIRYKGR